MVSNTKKIANVKLRQEFVDSIKNKSSREIFNIIPPLPIILLFLLNNKKDKTISNCTTISKYMNTMNAHVYNTVAFLELLGFIHSERLSRSKSIVITEKGQKFLKNIIEEIGDLETTYNTF